MPAPPMSSSLEVEMGGAANQAVDTDTDSDALSTNTTSDAEQTVTDSKGPESTFVTVAPQTPFDHTYERPVEDLVRRKHTEGAMAAAEAAKRPINWTENIIEMTEEERKKLRYVRFMLNLAPSPVRSLTLAKSHSCHGSPRMIHIPNAVSRPMCVIV
jgi:hypothetical protein